MLGEPQRRLGNADLSALALSPVHVGEGLLDTPRVALAHKRLEQV